MPRESDRKVGLCIPRKNTRRCEQVSESGQDVGLHLRRRRVVAFQMWQVVARLGACAKASSRQRDDSKVTLGVCRKEIHQAGTARRGGDLAYRQPVRIREMRFAFQAISSGLETTPGHAYGTDRGSTDGNFRSPEQPEEGAETKPAASVGDAVEVTITPQHQRHQGSGAIAPIEIGNR